MRAVFAGLLLSCAACHGQYLVPAAQTAKVEKLFEPIPADRPLRCQVTPFPAVLNFGFRFQTGYAIHLPMAQFSESRHRLGVIARVTPDGKDPVYLASPMRLPFIPKTKN